MTLRPIKVQLRNFLLVAVAVAVATVASVVVVMAILNLKPIAGPFRFSSSAVAVVVVARSCCVPRSLIPAPLVSLPVAVVVVGALFFWLWGFSGARCSTLLTLCYNSVEGAAAATAGNWFSILCLPRISRVAGFSSWCGYWTPACLQLRRQYVCVRECVRFAAPMAIMAIAVDASTADVSCGCIHDGCWQWLMILQQESERERDDNNNNY